MGIFKQIDRDISHIFEFEYPDGYKPVMDRINNFLLGIWVLFFFVFMALKMVPVFFWRSTPRTGMSYAQFEHGVWHYSYDWLFMAHAIVVAPMIALFLILLAFNAINLLIASFHHLNKKYPMKSSRGEAKPPQS